MRHTDPEPSDGAVRSGARTSLITVDAADTLDTSLIWSKLRMRKGTVVISAIAIFAALAAMILTLKPLYVAETMVMIDVRQARVTSFEQVLSKMPFDTEAVRSEVQVLQSRDLAQKAIRQLNLDRLPEFNRQLRPKTLLSDAEARVRALVRGPAPAPSSASGMAAITDTFLDNLKVSPVPESRAIMIRFTSEDPELAAKIANTLADLYMDSQIDAKLAASRRANAYLGERLTSMRADVTAAEKAVEAYRQNAGLVRTGNSLLVGTELSEADAMLSTATAKRKEAEARLQQISDRSQARTMPEVLASPLIARLREQEATLKQEQAQLSDRYGPMHPKLAQVRSSITDLDAKIAAETGKVGDALRTEVSVLRLNEASLKANVERLKSQLGVANDAEVQMRALEREADTSRNLLQTLLTRYHEIDAQSALYESDASIVSRADVPQEAAFPRPKLLFAGSGVVSLGLGCLLALVLERRKGGLKSMDDIEPLLGVRPLGLVPTTRRRRPETHLLESPESAFAESIRAVLTTVLLTCNRRQAILVTSALPGEGKTSTALALAKLSASMGFATVLLECDMRRPSLRGLLGIGPGPGLCDLLEGRVLLADILGNTRSREGAPRDMASRELTPRELTPRELTVVTSGSRTPNAPRLLASQAMGDLIDKLKSQFDVVILDSPPTSVVVDARLIAHLCDKTVFVARWSSTRSNLVSAELRRLKEVGATIAGVVLTRVDVRKHALLNYSDSGAFHGRSRKYYRD